MEDLLQQIEKALDCKLYFIALQSVLTLPDICSNLVNANPKIKVWKRYSQWYDTYVKNSNDKLSGIDCYFLRCSNLHQGSTEHPDSNFKKFLFIEPHPNFHFYGCTTGDCYLENLEVFCNKMIKSVRDWLPTVQNLTIFQDNYNKLLKRYPDLPGFSNIPVPYIG